MTDGWTNGNANINLRCPEPLRVRDRYPSSEDVTNYNVSSNQTHLHAEYACPDMTINKPCYRLEDIARARDQRLFLGVTAFPPAANPIFGLQNGSGEFWGPQLFFLVLPGGVTAVFGLRLRNLRLL